MAWGEGVTSTEDRVINMMFSKISLLAYNFSFIENK